MSTWRRKALETLPDHQEMIQRAENPMALWIDLHILFDKAVQVNDPTLIR